MTQTKDLNIHSKKTKWMMRIAPPRIWHFKKCRFKEWPKILQITSRKNAYPPRTKIQVGLIILPAIMVSKY